LREHERTTTTRTFNAKNGNLQREVTTATYTETAPSTSNYKATTDAFGFTRYDLVTTPGKTKRTVVTTTRSYDDKGRLVSEVVEDGPEKPAPFKFHFDGSAFSSSPWGIRS
jgi:hypothetical protein